MPFEPEFLEMMASDVTIATPTGYDKQNKPTGYNTALSFPAYVDFKSVQVADPTGNLTRSSAHVYMSPTTSDGTTSILPPISTQSKITVDGKTPRIIAINYMNDEVGLHHVEIIT